MDIEQQYDKLLRYCYMKLRDRALAEDLTQETFIKFFESKDYHSIGKEMAYLYTIARNLCIDYFRKHKDELIEDLPTKIQEMPESRDKVEDIVDRISIEQALDSLTADERELTAVVRREVEDPFIRAGILVDRAHHAAHELRIVHQIERDRRIGDVDGRCTAVREAFLRDPEDLSVVVHGELVRCDGLAVGDLADLGVLAIRSPRQKSQNASSIAVSMVLPSLFHQDFSRSPK